jgi:hypothetical protein
MRATTVEWLESLGSREAIMSSLLVFDSVVDDAIYEHHREFVSWFPRTNTANSLGDALRTGFSWPYSNDGENYWYRIYLKSI